MTNVTKKRGRRKTKALPAIPAMTRVRGLTSVADLTAAITAATLLEGALERAIAKRMVRMMAKEHNTIFHNGPLRNFQPKVQMARALNLFGSETEGDFKKIAEIRNIFAHSFSDVTFNTPKINKLCFDLQRPEMRFANIFELSRGKEDFDSDYVNKTAKLRYLKTVFVLIVLLEGSSTSRPTRDKAPWPRFSS